MLTWKEKLADLMDPQLAEEIDVFETQIALRKQDKLEEKIFAETRLRRGCYGQRYDNGHRYDGTQSQELRYPSGDLTKGPETIWDAPGMQRIKIPFGDGNTLRKTQHLIFLWKRLLVILGSAQGKRNKAEECDNENYN